MAKAIWKYKLRQISKLGIPFDFEILKIDICGDDVCMWVLVDPKAPLTKVVIRAYQTGAAINENLNQGDYIDSIQIMKPGSSPELKVFHFFLEECADESQLNPGLLSRLSPMEKDEEDEPELEAKNYRAPY